MLIREFYKENPLDKSQENIKSSFENVIKIEYHEPAGDGDAHYCDVYYNDGHVYRVFRPDSILF